MSIIRKSQLVLFGAGGAGGYALKYLRSQGIEPCCFADNNDDLWSDLVKPPIKSPHQALLAFPEATWVVTAIRRPAAVELRAQAKAMGVKTKPLWECLPVRHGLPPSGVLSLLLELAGDNETMDELRDQVQFRRDPNYDIQRPPSDINDIYFPEFIQHCEDEKFCDLGACEGDTVLEFQRRWNKYEYITAFEPDKKNFHNLNFNHDGIKCCAEFGAASDFDGESTFTATGDMSAHLGGGGEKVPVVKLDTYFLDGSVSAPTYIKADIEGAELDALWGARRILKECPPVLSICAYHTSDHFWQIPLLIHAIQPSYKLFFRRYAEGAFEIVWYAVPSERVIS